jgi:ribosome biogenesis GTPase
LIDRYLVASEYLAIPSVILLNKMDLLDEPLGIETNNRLKIYENIGYTVLYSSTYSKDGLKHLTEFLKNKTCVLVGISGVGKSSIIAALAHHTDIKIGNISEKSTGKHTTTTSRLYHLPTGGMLIDSPGVREFGLWHMDKQTILNGFKEFKSFLGCCKFNDCSHAKEPDCAIQKAIAEKKLSRERFASYLEMLKEVKTL